MKKLFVLLVLALFLCGCGGVSSLAPTADSPQTLLTDSGVWPENKHTEGLPIPPGTVSWSAVDPEGRYCAVELTGLSETDYRAYLDRLADLGFSPIEQAEESIKGQDYVAIGTLFSDGARGISISYLPDHLVLYLSRMD